MSALIYGLAGAVLLYILAMLKLYRGQRRRLYRPAREIITTPDVCGFEYQGHTLTTEDGVNLDSWFVPKPGASAVLMLFHGNTRNISHCLDSVEMFHTLGYSVFLFDYRGYGRSEGAPDERGTYRDAEAAWRFLTGPLGVPPERIIMLGRSLGAAIASWLAVRHRPRALVLESTFTSVPDIAAELHPLLPARLLSRYEYPVKHHLRAVDCPVLIVHSREDELIPFRHGRALYDLAGEPKDFLEIGGLHYSGFRTSGTMYVEGLARFLERCGPAAHEE